MKILSLLFLVFSASAYKEKSPEPTKDPLWVMLKCYGPKNGTFWVSMGHLHTSNSPDTTYFATELIYFPVHQSAQSERLGYFFDFKKSLSLIQIHVRPKGLRVEFPSKNGEQKNLVQIIQMGDERNAYMGNWTLSEAGKNDVMDQVACQIYNAQGAQ